MLSSIVVHGQMINSDGCEERDYPEVDPEMDNLDERMNIVKEVI